MRLAGDGDGQTQVQFPAVLVRGAFDPAQPVQTGQEDGLSYRLYRINGDFKARFDLHDYPFDTQQLLLHFQNTEQRRGVITYVIDLFALRPPGDGSPRAQGSSLSRLPALRVLRMD